jgi:hypothetical protein
LNWAHQFFYLRTMPSTIRKQSQQVVQNAASRGTKQINGSWSTHRDYYCKRAERPMVVLLHHLTSMPHHDSCPPLHPLKPKATFTTFKSSLAPVGKPAFSTGR